MKTGRSSLLILTAVLGLIVSVTSLRPAAASLPETACPGEETSPASEVVVAHGGDKITIGNRFLSRVFDISLGYPRTTRIVDKRSAAAKVVLTDFSDDEDRLVFDLATAYPVEGLTKLRRTFVFSRVGRGSLSVTDQVELKQAKAFETALITFSQWRRAAPNRLTIGSGDGAVSVEIDTRDEPFEIVSEEIKEDLACGKFPIRLAVRLIEPVASAAIQLTITPGGQ